MKLILFFVVAVAMTTCTFKGSGPEPKNVNGMSFLPLELPNKLEILVVHDARFKKSSAAMAVMVGSLEDPENALGMAHYLEHMLFLGTKDFPKPEEYSSFMEKHGGWDNAYTSDEVTNYMLEVDHGAIEEALQRFSRFFVDPLFTKDFLDREKNAVNNEFEKNIKQDAWRIDRFINTLASKDHPYHKFSTGNTQTLKSVTRDDVVKFYNRYYSANNMKLVIMSARPLSEIKSWAEKYFKDIPNKNVVRPEYKDFFINPDNKKRIHFVKSINDVEELTVLFNVPEELKFWETKPMTIIGGLVGDEGKGSLLSHLKAKGWALGLSAQNLWRSFAINVTLTKKGRKEYEEVTKTIFTYLDFVKDKGYPEYLFKDEKSLRRIDLDNLEPSSSGGRAAWFARAMTDYPVNEFLERNFLLAKYSPKDFNYYLNFLTPEKAHIIVTSQSEKTNQKEDIFGVEFMSIHFPDSLKGSQKNKVDFQYPEPNKYIPDNFSLVDSKKRIHSPVMEKTEQTDLIALQTDTEIGLSKAVVQFHLISAVEHNAKSKVMMDLFVQSKREELREWSYPISEARADFSLSSLKGDEMRIDISGYSQRMIDIFKDGIQNPNSKNTISSLNISEKTFNDIKDRYKRDLLNIEELVAYSRLSLEAGSVADSKGMNWRSYVKPIDSIKLKDVQAFVKTFFESIYVKSYAYGNVTKNSVEQALTHLRTTTGSKQLSYSDALKKESSFRVVPEGKNYSVIVEGKNNNHAHLALYRLADWTIANHARGLVLDQMLSQAYFNELRTKQQLGYVARSGVATHSGYVGLTAMIQSSQTESAVLQEKSDAFLTQFLKEKSETLADEELVPLKESIINELLLIPNTMGERAGQFFTAADKYGGNFDIRKNVANAVKSITAADIKTFIKSSFFKDKMGKIVFYYSSKGSKIDAKKLPGETFKDAHVIKTWDLLNPYM
jgi:insulysin